MNAVQYMTFLKFDRSRLARTYSILVIVPMRDVGPQLLHNRL